MNLHDSLRDTVVHGSYRFPFAIHEAYAEEQEHVMLYLHWHQEAELLLLLEGDAQVRVDDRTYTMKQGDVIFVPPYTLHAAYFHTSKSCRFLALCFQTTALGFHHDKILEDRYLVPFEKKTLRFPEHFSSDEGWQGEIRRTMQGLTAFIGVAPSDCELLVRGHLLSIWHHMYTHAQHLHMNNPDYDRLQPAIQYIYENYRSPITVKQLADQCSLSVSRFSSLFQHVMHATAIPYLQEYRIHQSCALLLSTSMTVAAIAMETGFGNLSNFNRNFLRIVGCPPSEFRDEARKLRQVQESQTLTETTDKV